MSFDALGLAPTLLKAIQTEGYTTPTPVQIAAIPEILAGHDLLASAQTGTGKTAAFALPILQQLSAQPAAGKNDRRVVRVLVLSPTRELATQISESFATYGRHTGLRRVCVYGGVSQIPQVKALRQGVDIIVATPGRLMDLINQGHINLRSVETLVLDEGDRMLDMGFLPDLRKIVERLPVDRQTMLFSATIPSAIEQLAKTILRNPVRVNIAPTQTTMELVEQSVCFVAKPDKRYVLAEFIASQPVSRAIVFTRTKHGADRLVQHLTRGGIRAEAMHGDKSQSARQKTLANFKSSRPPILVATDVAARGIDVDGVSHVFNYDLPNEPETYVHRIGRTGRAGAGGIAVSFCDHDERGHLRAIERLIRRAIKVNKTPAIEGRPLQEIAPSTEHSDERSGGSGRSGRPHQGSSENRPRKFAGKRKFNNGPPPTYGKFSGKKKPSGGRRPATTAR